MRNRILVWLSAGVIFFTAASLLQNLVSAQGKVSDRLSTLESNQGKGWAADALLEQRLTSDEKRITALEDLKMDSRMAKLESIADLVKAIAVAVIVQLILSIVRTFQSSRKPEVKKEEES
jgi:hypothetical protein